MTRILLIIVVFLTAHVVWNAAAATENEVERSALSESDRALLLAIESNDIEAVDRLLDAGADPNASDLRRIEGDGHSLCLATATGRESVLRRLLDSGADVDRLYGDNHFFGSPLTCAISRRNFFAFDILLEAGATPDLDVCTFCTFEMNNGPAEIALVSQRYREIWRLVELDAINPRALKGIVNALESYPAFGGEITNPYRRKLVEWLEAQGASLDLRTPLPEQPSSR